MKTEEFVEIQTQTTADGMPKKTKKQTKLNHYLLFRCWYNNHTIIFGNQNAHID